MPIVGPAPAVVMVRSEKKMKSNRIDKDPISILESHKKRKNNIFQAEKNKISWNTGLDSKVYSAILSGEVNNIQRLATEVVRDTTGSANLNEESIVLTKFGTFEGSYSPKKGKINPYQMMILEEQQTKPRGIDKATGLAEIFTRKKSLSLLKNIRLGESPNLVQYNQHSDFGLKSKIKPILRKTKPKVNEKKIENEENEENFLNNVNNNSNPSHIMTGLKSTIKTGSNNQMISNGTSNNVLSITTQPEAFGSIASPFGRLTCEIDIIFSKRYYQYFEFIAQINFSNRIIVNLNASKPIKYFIGKGNNSKLVKDIMRRRYCFYFFFSFKCMS
jgi:hypothetical protein